MPAEVIRFMHVGLAGLALGFFAWRGGRLWIGKPVLPLIWKRVIPDIVDTLLLISGITLIVVNGWSLWSDGWLQAKLAVVLVYITLGFMALDGRFAMRFRKLAVVAALLVFVYIVAVAHSKAVLPYGFS